MTGGTAALDFSASPLSLLAAQGHRCHVHGPVLFNGGRILFCKLMPGEDSSNASIEIQLAWPKGSANASSPAALILPDWLPTVINERLNLDAWPQPVLSCGGSVPAAFVRNSDDSENTLRQLVLYRGRSLPLTIGVCGPSSRHVFPCQYRMATAEEIAAEQWKFTTTNETTSVRVRGQR